MTAAITTEGLHKRYGARTAIHELDLTVEPGTVFGLIGPNGAGKTTTLRMLLDIIRPTAGQRPSPRARPPPRRTGPTAPHRIHPGRTPPRGPGPGTEPARSLRRHQRSGGAQARSPSSPSGSTSTSADRCGLCRRATSRSSG